MWERVRVGVDNNLVVVNVDPSEYSRADEEIGDWVGVVLN